jgi:hypothetical protein
MRCTVRQLLYSLVLVLLVGMNVSGVGCSKSATEKRAAQPDFSERMKQESFKGEVNGIGSNYVSIRRTNGEVMRVRVDDNTKMDQVVVGDTVKAYVSDDGYASTIQRIQP